MNHRPRSTAAVSAPLIVLLACALIVAAAPVPAAAQQASIPPTARTATDATPHQAVITQFVTQQVARLNDTKNPSNIRQARILLEAQVGSTASPSFMQIYSTALNAAVLPLANAKDLVTRLNAAIVVAHVAERTRSVELAPAAAKFMNDPQDPVALWGVKAAKSIIPIILNTNPNQDPLSPVLLNVVKKNWFSGAIAYEAYEAYRLNTNAPAGGAAGPVAANAMPPANPAAIKSAISGMLGLMTFRSELYAKGVPPQPRAEETPIEFLTRSKVWPSLAAAQQAQAVQQIVNIVSFAGQHCAVVGQDMIAPIANMLQTAGGGLVLIGGATSDTATGDAGKQLRTIGVSTPGETIFNTTSGAVTAVVGSPKWKAALKAPPVIGNAAGNVLSPSEPLDDDSAAPAATTAGGGAGAGTAPKGAAAAGTAAKGAAGGNAGGGADTTGTAGNKPAGTGTGAAGSGGAGTGPGAGEK